MVYVRLYGVRCTRVERKGGGKDVLAAGTKMGMVGASKGGMRGGMSCVGGHEFGGRKIEMRVGFGSELVRVGDGGG